MHSASSFNALQGSELTRLIHHGRCRRWSAWASVGHAIVPAPAAVDGRGIRPTVCLWAASSAASPSSLASNVEEPDGGDVLLGMALPGVRHPSQLQALVEEASEVCSALHTAAEQAARSGLVGPMFVALLLKLNAAANDVIRPLRSVPPLNHSPLTSPEAASFSSQKGTSRTTAVAKSGDKQQRGRAQTWRLSWPASGARFWCRCAQFDHGHLT